MMLPDITLRYIAYDCLTVFLLACSFVLRGRMGGEQPIGCLLVGLWGGFLWPILRELLLKGSTLAVFNSISLQIAVFSGSLCGLLLSFHKRSDIFARYSQTLAVSLTCTFGFLCSVPYCNVSGGLFLTFFLASIAFLLCDVAYGEIARFVTHAWEITRALLGTMLACLAISLLPLFAPDLPIDAVALFLGAGLLLLLNRFFPPKALL